MANQRQYDVTSVRLAIEKVGPSPQKIADYLGCARSTVYAYLRRYPELKSTFEDARGEEVSETVQYIKEVFERAIRDSHGVKAAVAAAVGCSRQTVDNALERWPDLAELMDAARSSLVSKATSALVKEIANPKSDGHTRAYMFVLKTLGKDEGFVERSEVTGANGDPLISPEIVELMERMGLNQSEVVRQFEQMVRMAAVKKGVVKE